MNFASPYTLSTSEKSLEDFSQSGESALAQYIDIHDVVDRHYKICQCAEVFLQNEMYFWNRNVYRDIHLKLMGIRDILGKNACDNCIFNPDNPQSAEAMAKLRRDFPDFPFEPCTRAHVGLVVPEEQTAVYQYCHAIPESRIRYAHHMIENELLQSQGKKKKLNTNWDSKFGYKVKRSTEYYGEVWFMDFVDLDIFLLEKHPGAKPYRPKATIVLDAYTGLIVSSVISSKEPTVYDVIACLIAAACRKRRGKYIGCCEHLIVDAGSQFKPDFFSDIVNKDRKSKAAWNLFCSTFLSIAGTTISQQPPEHPWVKTVERTNETIQYRFLRPVPLWTGGTMRRHNKDFFTQEHERLLDLVDPPWSMGKFAPYWFNHIIPDYNNYASPGDKSPNEMYKPNPDLFVPSWSTISVYGEYKTPVTVSRAAIRYRGREYTCPELAAFEGKTVLVYDFGAAAIHCLPVLYDNLERHEPQYVGMAYLSSASGDDDRDDSDHFLADLHIQTRFPLSEHSEFTFMQELNKLNDVTNLLQFNSFPPADVIPTHYGEAIDYVASELEGKDISIAALQAKADELRVIIGYKKSRLHTSVF